jgi:hypothetical protein
MQVTPQLFPSASELRSGQLVRLTDGRKGELVFQCHPLSENLWVFGDDEIEASQVESILESRRVDSKFAMSLLTNCGLDAQDLFRSFAGYDVDGEYPYLEDGYDLSDAIYEAISRAIASNGHKQFGWDVASKDVLDYIAGEEYTAKMQSEAEAKEERDNQMAYWTQPMF